MSLIPRYATAPFSGYARDKSPGRADDELQRVGPGTPCGELFRRYWLPIALSEEVSDRPLRVRILGEDLVLFRDGLGRLGLLDLHCAHRGTSLEFGRVRERGISCCYHGWHYDIDGTVLEAPTHAADSRVRERVFQGAYPAQEYGGMVFAYMGPADKKPNFAIYDVYERPGVSHKAHKFHWPCNWVQIRENGLDPLHVKYLHAEAGQRFPSAMEIQPTMAFEKSPLGLFYIATRRIGEMIYLRQNEIFLPHADWVNGLEDAAGETVFDRRGGGTDFVVPIDDENSYFFMMLDVYDLDRPSGMNGLWDRDFSWPTRQGLNYSIPTSGQHGNRPYEERQRSAGDWDAVTSQGPLHSHADENFGGSDAGVVLFRRRVREEIRKVQAGQDPIGLHRDLNGRHIRTRGHNTVMRVPKGRSVHEEQTLLTAFYREFLKEVMDGDLQQETPVADKLRIGREVVQRVVASV